MAKDYGRTPQKNQKSGFSKQLLLVLVSFLLGYLSALTLDFNNINAWVKTQLIAINPSQGTPKPVSQQAQLPKPKFEFYTLLASGEQAASPPSATQPTPSSASSTTAPPVKTQALVSTALANAVAAKPSKISKESSYMVQVASFKSKQEAERMKASLSLKGFIVSISAFTQQNTNWYRVALGPFVSRSQAEKAQASISKSEHIVGMIRKMNA